MTHPEPSLHVTMRFKSSRSFPPNVSEVKFDSYRIEPIPTSGEEEGLIEFQDEWVEGQKASNPLGEGRLILSWLAVVLRARLEPVATEINGVPTPPDKPYEQFLRPLSIRPDIENLFQKLCSLDNKRLRVYLRACDLYQLAAQVIDNRPSLANFLWVSAIECLAGIFTPSEKFKDSFLKFIMEYCPDTTLGKDFPQMPTRDLLSKIYDYRSMYAHGGKDVPVASLLATEHKQVWIKHYEDGKEELAPSIGWFESVVNASLIECLRRIPIACQVERKRQKLVELALSFVTSHLKARRSITAGQILTEEDIELQ